MSNCATPILTCRSILFLSALAVKTSVDIDNAFASGADGLCIDLEDAVPSGMKASARETLLSVLDGYRSPANQLLSVRINSLRTQDGINDVQAFLTRPHPANVLVLPKVETDEEMRWAGALADELRSRISFYGIIETLDGLEHCRGIARAHPRVDALLFGGHDMSAALGAEMAWESLLYARSRVVHAAASAQIQVIDSPHQAIADLRGLKAAVGQARALGMTGKAAKVASQIATIQALFTPSDDEVARAQHIINLYHEDPSAPIFYEGTLIELPMIKRSQRVAAFAKRM